MATALNCWLPVHENMATGEGVGPGLNMKHMRVVNEVSGLDRGKRGSCPWSVARVDPLGSSRQQRWYLRIPTLQIPHLYLQTNPPWDQVYIQQAMERMQVLFVILDF